MPLPPLVTLGPPLTREQLARGTRHLLLAEIGIGSVLAVAVVLVATTIAACGVVPSDPVSPVIGLRQDGDVLSVLIPDCPGIGVAAAAVESRSAEKTPPVWTSKGFTGDARRGIVLDARDWSDVDGDYTTLPAFGIEIDTDVAAYGAAIEPPLDRTVLQSLPAGEYYVEGEVMDAAAYFALVNDYDCPAVRPSSTG